MRQPRSRYSFTEQGGTFALLTPALSPGLTFSYVAVLGIALVGGIAFLVAGLVFPETLPSGWGMALLNYVLVIVVVAAVCWLLLSSMAGRQLIEFGGAAVRVRRVVVLGTRMVNVAPVARYPLEKVSHLRIYPALDRPRVGGPFAFDFAGRTVRFGGRLKEGEVREIWSEFRKRLPVLTAER